MDADPSRREADLEATWAPCIDERAWARLRESTPHPPPLLAKGLGPDTLDCLLVRHRGGFVGPAAPAGEAAQTFRYWRRWPVGEGDLADSPYLFTVRVFAPPEWQQPIRAWLDGEHFARQTAMEGVLAGEGYEPVAGPFHFFNLWAIAHPDLIDSPEWIEVRDTPWYDAVRPGFAASVVRRDIYRITSERGGV